MKTMRIIWVQTQQYQLSRTLVLQKKYGFGVKLSFNLNPPAYLGKLIDFADFSLSLYKIKILFPII